MLQLQNLLWEYYEELDQIMNIFGPVMIVISVISMIMGIVFIAAMWKIYSKAGEPGWAAIVPIYNTYVLFKITWDSGVRFLLLLVPVYNVILIIQTYVKLAKAFGKGGGFALGLLFMQPLFIMILGFGKSRYLGVPGKAVPAYAQGGYQQYPPQQYMPYQQPQYQPQQPQYQSQPPQSAPPPQMFCQNCGQRINSGEKFCQNCGEPQSAPPQQTQAQQTFCQNCGQRINPGEKFCQNCGMPQQTAQQETEFIPQRPEYQSAPPQYYPQYAQQKPKGHGGITFLNVLLAFVCAALLAAGIIIIPDNIKNARLPIQIFEEFPPDEEVSEQMRILEAGGTLFQQMPEGYVRPEHHEIAEWFHVDPDSDD